MTDTNHYNTRAAGWTYLICAGLLLSVGSWVQAQDFKMGMIVTEYVLVLLPVLIVGWYGRVNLKKALRLNRLKLSEILLIPTIVVLSLPITMFLNLSVIAFLSYFDKAYDLPVPSAGTLEELSVLFFIISISAGFCEEFFFRGMILDAYVERLGIKNGIVFSAVLFGIFHFNPQNFLGPVFLGLMFGYLVIITQSIWAGILGHMANNGAAVLLMYAANLAQKTNPGISSVEALGDTSQLLMALGVLAVFAAASGLAVWGLMGVIAKDRKVSWPLTVRNCPARDMEQAAVSGERLSLSEIIPVAIPAAIYIIICAYILVIK